MQSIYSIYSSFRSNYGPPIYSTESYEKRDDESTHWSEVNEGGKFSRYFERYFMTEKVLRSRLYPRKSLVIANLCEGSLFVLFLICCAIIFTGLRSKHEYFLTKAMNEAFVESRFHNSRNEVITFAQIKTAYDVRAYEIEILTKLLDPDQSDDMLEIMNIKETTSTTVITNTTETINTTVAVNTTETTKPTLSITTQTMKSPTTAPRPQARNLDINFFNRTLPMKKFHLTEPIDILRNNIWFGSPRFRQKRVSKNSCYIHRHFLRDFQTCYGYFDVEYEEKDPIITIVRNKIEYNETTVNGTEINETKVNGTEINGPKVNGTEVSGPGVTKTQVSRTGLTGTEVNETEINETEVNGTDPIKQPKHIKYPLQDDDVLRIYWESETHSVNYRGKVSKYDASGYTLNWLYNQTPIVPYLDYYEVDWINKGTRVIFFNANFYNVPLNLFVLVQLVVEFAPEGCVLTSSSIRSYNFIRYRTFWDHVILCLEFVFLIFLAWFVLEEIYEIYALQLAYFTSLRNLLDLSIIIISGLIIYHHTSRNAHFQTSLQKFLHKSNNDYVSLELVKRAEDNFNFYAALLLLAMYLKLLYFLSFARNLTIVWRAFKIYRVDLFGLFMLMGIWFVAFAASGWLLYGPNMQEFSTFFYSFYSIFRMLFGDFNYSKFEEHDKLTPVFFVATFTHLIYLILTSLFLALLFAAYMEVKSKQYYPREIEQSDLVKQGFYSLFSCCGRTNYWWRDQYKRNVRQIKKALIECQFNELEVEFYMAQFDIPERRPITEHDINLLIIHLFRNGYLPTEAPPIIWLKKQGHKSEIEAVHGYNLLLDQLALKQQIAEGDTPETGLTYRDYDVLMDRLEQTELQAAILSDDLNEILAIVEMMQGAHWSAARKDD